VLMVVGDGPTGPPDAIAQTCVVHLLPNGSRQAGRKCLEAGASEMDRGSWLVWGQQLRRRVWSGRNW
jgi:hypothetical protein